MHLVRSCTNQGAWLSQSYESQQLEQWRCSECCPSHLPLRACMQAQSDQIWLWAKQKRFLFIELGSRILNTDRYTCTVVGLAKVTVDASNWCRHDDTINRFKRCIIHSWYQKFTDGPNRPYFCLRICGQAARETMNEPRRCTRWIRSQSASLVRARERSRRMPALLINCGRVR